MGEIKLKGTEMYFLNNVQLNYLIILLGSTNAYQ